MSIRYRVGVDMHTIMGIHQGSRTHLLDLYAQAISLAPEIDFVFLGASPEALVSHHDAYRSRNVTMINMKHTGPIPRLLWHLPHLERELSLDFLHLQYISPIATRCKIAVTIHDLLFESYKDYFTLPFRLRSSLLMRRSSHHAKLVFTVSEFSKTELVECYGVPPAKIHVTPNAADRSRFFPGTQGSEYLTQRSLSYRGYILSVGRLEPRKNYPLLLRAYAELHDAPRLIIVGQKDFWFDEVLTLIEQLSLGNRVTILSDVGSDELTALYRNALCFVYASVAEGFGMPVMEAFASGTPVVCCNSTALKEIASGAAYLVQPDDLLSLREGLSKVLADATLRSTLIENGLIRAAQYQWSESARVLVSAFRSCMNN